MTASVQAIGRFFRELDGEKLKAALILPDTEFSHTQRSQLWAMIKDNLTVIIKDGRQLEGLLSLTSEQLSTAQKSLIVEALKEKLPEYVEANPKLTAMLNSIQYVNLDEATSHISVRCG